jgi:hypothetical protein
VVEVRVLTALTDSPEPLMPALLLKVPAVLLATYTVSDTVLPPNAAAGKVAGFGSHVIPVAVPLPFTVRLTMIVT